MFPRVIKMLFMLITRGDGSIQLQWDILLYFCIQSSLAQTMGAGL